MFKELDIILEGTDIVGLKLYCERAMKGKISDQDWRDYQLNAILNNSQTLKMDGYKEHGPNSITYVFTSGLLVGCMGSYGLETPLKYVSHVLNSIRIVDNKPIGTIKVFDSHVGRELKLLLDNDTKLKLRTKTYNGRIFRLDI